MIIANNDCFALQTAHTTYLFRKDAAGNLLHLYYGESIELDEGQLASVCDLLQPVIKNPNGCSLIADTALPAQCLDDVCLEISSRGKGDMREPFVELVLADGSKTSDFRYESFQVIDGLESPDGLPGAYDAENQAQSLLITLTDRNSAVKLELIYGVLEECDCITRYARLINGGEETVRVERLMSMQLDMSKGALKINDFHGDWAREMNRNETILRSGKYINDTGVGFSSNRANPLFLWADTETTQDYGDCYATNLIYSGNHREYAEAGGHGKMRILSGINPDFFEWELAGGEVFCAPQAVMTYSHRGYQGVSRQLHHFVREHIVRGEWKHKERPILINSWEAMYFDVQEKKLLRLAKVAAETGIELFVLDDGWFGKRNNDASSLGDWYDNKEKLPEGLAGLSQKLHKLGMKFGIWVEPEMVSEDSDLYREHPDWAVRIPGKEHAFGRNQMILDLTRQEVREYIIESMSDVFTRGQVDYVKWDMNRNMSDYYSQALPTSRQGEFAHRYILGLYQVLYTLTEKFPHILFEGCASGGNRFDLGMLCYMPQIWASDNTDAISRASIQNSYSYGYPQSVIAAHVSGSPNHQTLRITPLPTRFAVASAGILGYECNLCDASREDMEEIRAEILLYKEWRSVLQFGEWYRLYESSEKQSVYDTDVTRWNIVSPDKSKAVGIMIKGQTLANYAYRTFQAKGLDAGSNYHFYNRSLRYDIHRMGDLINTMAPVHVKQDSFLHGAISKFIRLDGEKEDKIVSGAILDQCGIPLAQNYAGTGYEQNTALYQDYDARMYFMEKV